MAGLSPLLDTAGSLDLTPYAGRWVAVVRGRVAGVGVTERAARLAAKRCRPKEEPTVLFVPSETASLPQVRLSLPSLVEMSIDIAPSGSLAEQVCCFLREQDSPIWLVGGYVRDLLLGRETNDLDFAVPSGAIPLARAVADRFNGAFFPLDERLDMGRALLQEAGQTFIVDICRLRGPDLAGDLALRDFTINAMALDLHADRPELIDLQGGRQDLAARLVRAVSERSFRDDPVRLLRAVRLAAELGFTLEEQTVAWLQRDAAWLAWSPLERVRYEMVRIVALAGAADHLRQLDSLGLLGIVLPEVVDLQGVEQSPPHTLDAYEHSLETIRQLEWLLEAIEGSNGSEGTEGSEGAERITYHASRITHYAEKVLKANLSPFASRLLEHLARSTSAGRTRGMMLKWAALLHDLGKAKTRSLEADGKVRFLQHEVIGAELAAGVLRRLRFTNAEVDWVETLVRQHMRPALLAHEPALTRRAVYRFFRDAGEVGVDTCLLSLADQLATWGPNLPLERWTRRVDTVAHLLEAYFTRHKEEIVPRLLLSGRDLQEHFGLAEGPRIGELLEALREAQAMGEVSSRDEALALVRRLLAEDVGGQKA
ncbi:MAG: HD domain-containing protein [Anaerolineae bacterium]|nr:HD domain-containing protein [Anaerolineae bacterium]